MSREPEVVTAGDGAVANMGRRMSQFNWTDQRRGTQVDFQDVVDEAQMATEHERQMGIFEAIRLYPKAVGWSVLASTALVMEGYDLVVIGSFYAFPTFQRKYGILTADGTYQITAAWETGLSNGAVVGEILGLMITGIVADHYGYRFTIGMALCLVVCFIFITFFAVNIEMLLVGEILCGLPWGVFQTITTAYAAEVTPVPLRPYLTTYVNLCWVFGQFIGSGVLRGMLNYTTEWGYRIPFALQWMWPLPLLVGIIFAPESPWWLVRHDRLDDAEHALLRLTSKGTNANFDAQKTIAMMVHTNELEKENTTGTSYIDCWRGTDRRRTEIACIVWVIQTLCGSGLYGFSSQFYVQAGLSTTKSFDFQMGQYAIGAVGTLFSWFLMVWFGRRTLYIIGLIGLDILLLIMGFTSLAPKSDTAAPFAIGTMLMVFAFVYDATIGPVCYSLVAEIPSTRLRSKTIVLARNFYNIAGIFNNIVTPRMLNPTGWNWGAKAAFFWAGFCTLCLIWTYFRLPEPKGKTYAELDVLFERHISARKFGKATVDPFRGDTLETRRGTVVKAGEQRSDEDVKGADMVEKV